PYLAQCVVAVGFLNRHVTMMGAVSPRVLPLPNNKMTILDALAATGDIGDKGKTKEFKRLNLTDESVFYSPYFYLQPDDIVYVEPVKKKAENTTRIVGYVTSGLSLLIFI